MTGFRWLMRAVVALSLCAALGWGSGADDSTGPSTNQAPTLPAIVLSSLSGKYVFLSSFCYAGAEQPRKPRSPVVLNFMASDCAPCRKELPVFLKVMRESKGANVRPFLVSTDPISKRASLERMLKEFKADCDVLLDPYQVACKKLGFDGIPRTFVIAPTGEIVAQLAGATDDYEAQLRSALEKACGGNATTQSLMPAEPEARQAAQ